MRSRLATTVLLALLALTVGLLVASLVILWQSADQVIRHERDRAEFPRSLGGVSGKLEAESLPFWPEVPPWPRTMSELEWDALDLFLAAEVVAPAFGPTSKVEAGFYVPLHDRFLGRAPRPDPATHGSEPPPSVLDALRGQVRQSLDDGTAHLSLVADADDQVSAVHTAPVRDASGQIVAVSWATGRLDGSLFADRATAAGYRTAAVFAAAGVGLALTLTGALVALSRRQARERRRFEAELRQSERLAALGKLLAGVAHEVRNPLAGIRSSAQLWLRGLGPEPDSISRVIAEVDRIESLVSQLLRFTRSPDADLRPTDINAVVSEAAELARPQAEPIGVRVESCLDDRVEPLPADPTSLLQVLRNLTTNSLQAMPEGGRLRLSTHVVPSSRAIEIVVADEGPGLSEAARAHLFEPFFTTRAEGTGLGLAIAREIVLAHGGQLEAGDPSSFSQVGGKSLPRSGCSFTIRLPLRTTDSSSLSR